MRHSRKKGFGVRAKMTGVFLLLIVMMIWMGILNYTRARDAIVDTYVKDKDQTFKVTGK